MSRKPKLVASLVASALAAHTMLTPAPAAAQNGATIAAGIGGLMLGMIAAGAMAQQGRGQQRVAVRARPRPKPRVQISSATVAVQNALTWVGLYSGPITGKMDTPTKTAIRALQAKSGDRPTGVLTEAQRRALLTAYAQRGQGMMATGPTPSPDSIFAVIAGGAAGAAFVAQPSVAGSVAPAPTSLSPAGPAYETARAPDTWRLQCQAEEPRLDPAAGPGDIRSARGSLVPGQFCAARLGALLAAKDAFAKLGSVEPAQVRLECARISDTLAPLRTALAVESSAAIVKRATKEFATVGPDQKESAATNFQVCIGYGFADNSPEIVLSSALALVGIGEAAYGELIGGAFGMGVGLDANRIKAAAWLDQAAEAIDKGAVPVIRDRGVERAEILRLTSAELKALPKQAPAAQASPRESERVLVPSFGSVSPAEKTGSPPVARAASATPTSPKTPDTQLAKAEPLAAALQVKPPSPIAPMQSEGRRAVADAFFTAEQADHARRLEALASGLGLDPLGLGSMCASQDLALSASKPEAAVTLRLCRSHAYSRGDRPAMYRFDRALSDLGDQDAEGRLPRHLLLGHDRPASLEAPKVN